VVRREENVNERARRFGAQKSTKKKDVLERIKRILGGNNQRRASREVNKRIPKKRKRGNMLCRGKRVTSEKSNS